MAFDYCGKTVPERVPWEELAAVITMKDQVLLDLSHYDPERRTVGALGVS